MEDKNQINFKEEFFISVSKWYDNHKNHTRLHRTVTLGEYSNTGEIVYSMAFCKECEKCYVIDKFEIEK